MLLGSSDMSPDDCVPTGSYWDRHENCDWPLTTCPACLSEYSYHSCEGHDEYCNKCEGLIFKGGDLARQRILNKAIISKKLHVCKTCKIYKPYNNGEGEGWCSIVKEIVDELDSCNGWKQKHGVFAKKKKVK